MKSRVFEILSIDEGEDRISRAVDTALLLLILGNVAALVIAHGREHTCDVARLLLLL